MIPDITYADMAWMDAAKDALDTLAKRYENDVDVVGFRVFGPKEIYEDYWLYGPLPNRFASGEWTLVSGNDGFEPIFRNSRFE